MFRLPKNGAPLSCARPKVGGPRGGCSAEGEMCFLGKEEGVGVCERRERGLHGRPQHTPSDHVMVQASEAHKSLHPSAKQENQWRK